MTANLIGGLFLPLLGNDVLGQLDDAAVVGLDASRIAVSIDSYVVSPIIFPGGNIGSLAVHGTVNDLAMRGARPLYLSASFILEEGLKVETLACIAASLNEACLSCGVTLIAADTKVVNKGCADQLFITTCGVGIVSGDGVVPSASQAKPGDFVLVSGDIGRHGIAIMAAREGLDLETTIESDSAPLHRAVQEIVSSFGEAVHVLRDVTRGGLAGVLNEIAIGSDVGIEIDEHSIPIHAEVRGACEILGLDPLYVACEGRFVTIVQSECGEDLIETLKKQPSSESAQIIGRVTASNPGRVVLRSSIGGRRIVDLLSGEQLPRIC